MGKALLGTRRGFLRRRRRARRQFQPIEHAPLGSRFFLRALRWLGRLRRLGRQLQAVEHAAPRLSLGRGLRIPCAAALADLAWAWRSEEHTSELQSLMRISYAVFCLKKKTNSKIETKHISTITRTND